MDGILSKLKLFEDDCVDELTSQICEFEAPQTNQSLFVNVMNAIINKRYHYQVIESKEFNRGIDVGTKVLKLEVQVQKLQSTNDPWIQKLKGMSNRITSLEAELQCLEHKKLELQNQVRAMEASPQYGALNF